MRRLLPVLAFLIWVAPAHATPTITAGASTTLGQAPLDVTLTATGDAVSYHWNLGDGTQADGAIVQHRYEAGKFTATATGTAADGTQAQASVTITAVRIILTGPKVGTYGRRAVFKGRLKPALRGAPVSLFAGETEVRSGKADRKGRFHFRLRLRAPGTFTARFGSVVSNAAAVPLRPGLDVALPSSRTVGQALVLRVAVKPKGSGSLKIRIWRGGHELRERTFGDRAALRLSTGKVADYVVRIAVEPNGTYRGRRQTVRANVLLPYLSVGSHGPSVRILERRLAELRYAVRGVDTYFSYDTQDAILAFQNVHGMARTGAVSPTLWRRLQTAHAPVPRYRGSHHIEVDKSRQVLFEVDGGSVRRVVHVSTGATGNTPVGRWHVYSKVPGFLPSGMYYSSFFLRGFAIHGYHSVPSYPASHGCVRVPIWIAPTLFAGSSYGETIYVYY
ncbi:MAG: L,D-transpeptidase family protein [Actinomycetota bacterium]